MVAFLWLLVSAWGAQVQLRVEPSELIIGQAGTAAVVVVTGGRGDARALQDRAPRLATDEGVAVEVRGSRQQYMNRNDQIMRIHEYQYRITALEEGSWQVGPVEIPLSDGTTAVAEAVTVTVRQRSAADESRAEVEVTGGFGQTNVWEGQVVLYGFRFESRIPGSDVEWKLPRFDGLRIPQQGKPVETEFVVDDPEGSILVRQGLVPLIATGTGKRDQGRAIAQVRIPVGRAGPFGFRRARTEPYYTDDAELTVRPLPPAPPGFSGLVGDFEVKSRLQPTAAVVGQSLDWELRVFGQGALEGFSLPPYEAPKASIYEKESRSTARIDGGKYAATASFQRVVVPTESGELSFPAFELITFSPTRGDYVTHRVELPTVEVRPGREGDGAVTSFADSDEALVESVEDEGVVPRPIVARGAASIVPAERWLPWLMFAVAGPGLAVLAHQGFLLGRRRWDAWQLAQRREATSAELVEALPPGEDPLAWLDRALSLAESEATAQGETDEILTGLRARLQRLRFSPGAEDPSLEEDIRQALIARGEP